MGRLNVQDVIERDRLLTLIRPVATDIPLIRVGAFGDGGYLVPDDLRGIAGCFSPGVSLQSTFELDLAKRSIPSFMADYSVDGAAINVPGASFLKKFVGATADDKTVTLNDWIAENDPDPSADLLLQMDIEGAEYDTFAALDPALLARFRIVVMELHFIPSILLRPRFFSRAAPLIEKLAAQFTCVHLHPNNAAGSKEIDGLVIPRVVEVTFLRNDRVCNPRPVIGLPHPLDVPNTRRRADLALPPGWYS